ncbi:MAG: tetratricopeptide (TPR) repeat protein, partial [Chitinophagales bacterium]
MGRVKEGVKPCHLVALHAKAMKYYGNQEIQSATRIAKELLRKSVDLDSKIYQAKAQMILGYCHYVSNNLRESIDCFEKALARFILEGNRFEEVRARNSLGVLYKLQGDYRKALIILKSSFELSEKYGIPNSKALNNTASLYALFEKYEKAINYYNLAIQEEVKLTSSNFNSIVRYEINKANTLLKIKEIDQAQAIIKKHWDYVINNNQNELIFSFSKGVAKIEMLQYNYVNAEKWFMKALNVADGKLFKFYQVEILLDLSLICGLTNRRVEQKKLLLEAVSISNSQNHSFVEKSLIFLIKYYEDVNSYKDASCTLSKLLDFRKSSKAREPYNRSLELQDEFESKVLDSFMCREHIFRKSLKEKNEQLSEVISEYKKVKLKLKLLQEQLNPGLIFSILQDIQMYTLKGEALEASDYIADLASLMRRVLRNSRQEKVSINDELELVQNYLQLEKRRGKYAFDFTIHVDPALDTDKVVIPPFLFQNLVKKAVVK